MAETDKNIRETVIIHKDCKEEFLSGNGIHSLANHGVLLAGISHLATRYVIARPGQPTGMSWQGTAGQSAGSI